MLQAASMQHTAYDTGIAYSSLQDLYAKRLMAGDWRLAISQVASHSAIFYQVYQNCKKDHLRTFSLRFVAQEAFYCPTCMKYLKSKLQLTELTAPCLKYPI